MDLEQDREDIEDFLKLQPAEVRNDCKIVSYADLGYDFMLRIDKKPPEKFIPNMPKSAMSTENTSTPRITAAPTLVGCMIGYFRIERDIQDGSVPDKAGEVKFAGGYSICKLPFTHCLKPGKAMVVDSMSSDEHWLVPYSVESVEYDPIVIGQLFVGSITYLPVSNHSPSERIEMYLHVDADVEVAVMPDRRVGRGFYRFTVFWPNWRLRSVQDKNSLIGFEVIDQATYMHAKGLKAALLSKEEQLPGFTGWK